MADASEPVRPLQDWTIATAISSAIDSSTIKATDWLSNSCLKLLKRLDKLNGLVATGSESRMFLDAQAQTKSLLNFVGNAEKLAKVDSAKLLPVFEQCQLLVDRLNTLCFPNAPHADTLEIDDLARKLRDHLKSLRDDLGMTSDDLAINRYISSPRNFSFPLRANHYENINSAERLHRYGDSAHSLKVEATESNLDTGSSRLDNLERIRTTTPSKSIMQRLEEPKTRSSQGGHTGPTAFEAAFLPFRNNSFVELIRSSSLNSSRTRPRPIVAKRRNKAKDLEKLAISKPISQARPPYDFAAASLRTSPSNRSDFSSSPIGASPRSTSAGNVSGNSSVSPKKTDFNPRLAYGMTTPHPMDEMKTEGSTALAALPALSETKSPTPASSEDRSPQLELSPTPVSTLEAIDAAFNASYQPSRWSFSFEQSSSVGPPSSSDLKNDTDAARPRSVAFQIVDAQTEGEAIDSTNVRLTITSISTMNSEATSDNKLPDTLKLSVFFEDRSSLPDTQDALLDTGAKKNFVSKDYSDFLGHKMESYEGPALVAASGAVTPIGTISIYFRWSKTDGTQKTKKAKFLVVEELPVDMILGKKFIELYEILQFNGKFLPILCAPLTEEDKKKARRMTLELKQARELEEKREAERLKIERQKQRELRRQLQLGPFTEVSSTSNHKLVPQDYSSAPDSLPA